MECVYRGSPLISGLVRFPCILTIRYSNVRAERKYGIYMLSKGNILLVEDNHFERNSLHLMLEQEGYCVTPVHDGPTALTQLDNGQFDIVITDLRMPNMTGIDLLKAIKVRNIESAVIVITAYGELRDAVNAIKAGAHDFIEKNLDIDQELMSAMRQISESRSSGTVAS